MSAETTLLKKLRLQAGDHALVINAPTGYVQSLGVLPEGVLIAEHADGKYDFIHLFVRNSTEFRSLSPVALGAIRYDGVLWISYPKKSAKVETDLSRDLFWKLMEGSGLRPVTQIAIDEVWSALRFRPEEKVGK